MGDKMKKILFTDLDGTLLNNEKVVSEGNRAAIQKLLDAGHYFVIATGRSVKNGYDVAKKLGLTMPGCYMVAYNGAVLFDCAKQKRCMEKALPMEHVQYLFQEAKKYGMHVQTYGKGDKILTETNSSELQFYIDGHRRALDYEICEDVCQALDREPNKVLIIDRDEERILQFWREHKEWEKGRCESTFSCKEYLEYLPVGVSKGSGVRMLCEILGVKIENAYAAGDERNDISMIEAAGVGIAMKNAVDEAKAVADYITEHDNNNDGIAEVIEKLILEA